MEPPKHPNDNGAWGISVGIDEVVDAVLTLLALVFAVLLVLEFTADLSARQTRWVGLVSLIIWSVFTVDFVARFAFAESKSRYLRRNWLTGIAVFLPAFRVVRILHALRVLRLVRLGRVVTVGNRSLRATQRVAGESSLYVALLAVVALFLAAAGAFTLERGAADARITTFPQALWWAATTLTTIGSGFEPVTFEGRLLAILVMIIGLGLSGYITARVAVLLLGRERAQHDLAVEVASLREELVRLRESLELSGDEKAP